MHYKGRAALRAFPCRRYGLHHLLHRTADMASIIRGNRSDQRGIPKIPLTGYSFVRIFTLMDLIKVYQCLCDATRLRILNLLLEGPLCVCHLVEVLGLEQPKVSRHLKALRGAGAVEATRCYNWTIYRLADAPNALLEANLKCLQDLRGEERQFGEDLRRRERIIAQIQSAACVDLPEAIRCIARGSC